MPWFRAYIDKKVTDKGGGDHSRVHDAEAEDEEAFRDTVKLKKDEDLNQIVSLQGAP